MESVPPAELRQVAARYASELDALDPENFFEWLAEVASESPFWDDRTNALALGDGSDADLGLVLSDACDEVLIRFDGTRWTVEELPPDGDGLDEIGFSDR